MGPAEPPSDDATLLAAVRGGSVDALGRLYARHADAVYGLARRVTGSDEEAEEVLQDVFVGLPRAARSYDERGRFASWLKRVVVRASLMRLRSARRKREAPLAAVAGAAEAAGAATAQERPIDRIALERLVARLPEPLRVVFVLREIEGYTHAEIGQLLGISAGNSAVRLNRAWAALRKEARSA
jgi:RNA polymerase sigma-70 factor (ECF subfamily)